MRACSTWFVNWACVCAWQGRLAGEHSLSANQCTLPACAQATLLHRMAMAVARSILHAMPSALPGRRRTHKLPMPLQRMLLAVGLRGAVAYGLGKAAALVVQGRTRSVLRMNAPCK